MARKPDDERSERAVAERVERALRPAFTTPPKPHGPIGKQKERPASKGRVRKGRSRS